METKPEKKKKKIKKRTLLIILIVLLAGIVIFFSVRGCSSSDTETTAGRQQTPGAVLTEAEAEAAQIITLKPGDEIAVELEENPSTGYIWHYTIEDERIIEFESDEYKAPDAEEPPAGAPGKRLFRFRANAEGATSVRFEKYRTWEEEVINKHIFNFEVR